MPLIASTNGSQPTAHEIRGGHSAGLYVPWALADVAWVSLAFGNEHRGTEATEEDLREILAYYISLDEPMRRQKPGTRLGGFLLRLSGQQLSWQESEFSEVARTIALLDTKPTRPLKCILPGWDKDLFGCGLRDYLGTALLVWGGAALGRGRFDPLGISWDPEDLLAELDTPAAVAAVIENNFATTARRLRDEAAAAKANDSPPVDPATRRFTFNPLRSRPVLSDYGPGYLVPVRAAVLGKVSPYGIYYSGIARYGCDFAHDLGDLFEQYVGRQLGLLPEAVVHPEIIYTEGRGEEKSVDWFVVFDDLVLLVEAKSARPTASLRLGPVDFEKELNTKLSKAVEQIDRSASKIASGDPAFAHIPADRPLLGMVVTMEPYHMVNAPEFRGVLAQSTVPVTVASVSELEDAVVLEGSSLASELLAGASPAPDGWSVREILAGRPLGENPILTAAWDSLPFSWS